MITLNSFTIGNLFCRLTDLGGVGKKLSQDYTSGDLKTSSSPKGAKLRRSHSMSEIASELGVNLRSEVNSSIKLIFF